MAGKYKNKYETDDGNVVYEYSDKQVQHRHREKAKRLEKLRNSIDKLRKKVKEDLKSDSMETKLKALAVALIDETYGRVGNESSVEERGHYGVTVWKKKHLSFSGNKVTIKYTGKAGVDQTKTVENAQVVKVLKDIVEDKGKDDFLFDCGDEDDKTCIRGSEVNDYLKQFDITAKDLRGFHSNRLMQEALKEVRKKGKKLPENKKEREKLLKEEFKEALEQVAEDIGHEASTLKSNYLVPSLEDDYLDDGSVNTSLHKDSSVVLAQAAVVARRYMARLGAKGIVLRPEGWEATGPEGRKWLRSIQRSGHVYRGMENAEYQNTVGAGKPVLSSGRYSHSSEGTSFAPNPEDAESYANFGRSDPRVTGKPTWLVEVRQTDSMYVDTDGYVKSREPVDTVTRVWKMTDADGDLVAIKQ